MLDYIPTPYPHKRILYEIVVSRIIGPYKVGAEKE